MPIPALRRALLALALAVSVAPQTPANAAEPGASGRADLFATDRLKIGLGDRLLFERDGEWRSTLSAARHHGLRMDLFQIWLTRSWQNSWIEPRHMKELHARGITPVVVHYFFGDGISKEAVERSRSEWMQSLERMAKQIRGKHPVLVVLEPEFNVAPPRGQTPIVAWPGFAEALRAAAKRIREIAPNARVGTCAGDFPGTPMLENVLGPVAADLDFLAFQEMRAATDPDRGREGYVDVGRSAVDYARYLKRAFGRPILLAYIAVSSHDGWLETQQKALRGVLDQRSALLEAGVFGAIYFQLFDDPEHTGYFGPAERGFGLLDRHGAAKPALGVYRALTR